MKKQLILLAIGLFLTTAFRPVFATDVGKIPTKAEVSVAKVDNTGNLIVYADVACVYESDFITIVSTKTTQNEVKTFLEKGSQHQYLDAAIPIRNVRLNYNKTTIYNSCKSPDYNCDKYWC
jgi:hypothetical protein